MTLWISVVICAIGAVLTGRTELPGGGFDRARCPTNKLHPGSFTGFLDLDVDLTIFAAIYGVII